MSLIMIGEDPASGAPIYQDDNTGEIVVGDTVPGIWEVSPKQGRSDYDNSPVSGVAPQPVYIQPAGNTVPTSAIPAGFLDSLNNIIKTGTGTLTGFSDLMSNPLLLILLLGGMGGRSGGGGLLTTILLFSMLSGSTSSSGSNSLTSLLPIMLLSGGRSMSKILPLLLLTDPSMKATFTSSTSTSSGGISTGGMILGMLPGIGQAMALVLGGISGLIGNMLKWKQRPRYKKPYTYRRNRRRRK